MPHLPHQPRALLIALLFGIAAPAAGQEARPGESAHGAHAHAVPRSDAAPVLLPGLGSWTHPVSTGSRRAQQFFDQGLRLAYAFNHDEAERSFAEAARLDPSCAMCFWGIAYAAGPNINLPVSPEAEERALAAVRSAQRLASSARERAYVDAMAQRVGDPAGADRPARDSAYATAMGELARANPADDDAQVLHADALLNLRPWNQWTRDGKPQPGTREVVRTLERVIARSPRHAGACHLYVHAVEASTTPERALACAERLPRLMPGAGHVVHMPAHVYLRVGRYADAARANVAAMAADRRYLAEHGAHGGIYPMFYARHNGHFLWSAYVMSGQRARALDVARTLVRGLPVEQARAAASLEAILTTELLTQARFERWETVLAMPSPDTALRYATGMHRFARGLAFASTGSVSTARHELDSLRAIARGTPASVIVILNPARSVLELAERVLAARIAEREGHIDEAITLLREAIGREDALTYDEPPPWYHSARHLLGRTLLAAGKARDAELAFRDDLRVYRENGWSLAGLAQALRAQGKSAEARAVGARLKLAWADADVSPMEPAKALVRAR